MGRMGECKNCGLVKEIYCKSMCKNCYANYWYKRRMEKNPRPYERISKGLVQVHKPEHPNAFGGYVNRCRLVMEDHLGRPLTKEEESCISMA